MLRNPSVKSLSNKSKMFINNLPKDNFSPESGGSVKSRTAIDEISKQGTIKLKK